MQVSDWMTHQGRPSVGGAGHAEAGSPGPGPSPGPAVGRWLRHLILVLVRWRGEAGLEAGQGQGPLPPSQEILATLVTAHPPEV